ncbi:MAG: phosphoribosylglycinamide formyltransferase [Verrucomicrobiota bacterium]
MPYKIAIVGSGRGSNAHALLKAESNGTLGEAEIVGILSDREDSGILKHARDFEKAARYERYSRKTGDAAYLGILDSWAPDLVVLAGFMRIVGNGLLERWEGKLINLHPSLLPSFKGLDAIGQAWTYGVKVSGCTVHWVNADLDGGCVIDQSTVLITEDDSRDSFEAKIHVAEHRLLVDVVRRLSVGEIQYKPS